MIDELYSYMIQNAQYYIDNKLEKIAAPPNQAFDSERFNSNAQQLNQAANKLKTPWYEQQSGYVATGAGLAHIGKGITNSVTRGMELNAAIASLINKARAAEAAGDAAKALEFATKAQNIAQGMSHTEAGVRAAEVVGQIITETPDAKKLTGIVGKAIKSGESAGSYMGRLGAKGAELASKGTGWAAKGVKVLGTAGRVASKVALPLDAALTAYNVYNYSKETDRAEDFYKNINKYRNMAHNAAKNNGIAGKLLEKTITSRLDDASKARQKMMEQWRNVANSNGLNKALKYTGWFATNMAGNFLGIDAIHRWSDLGESEYKMKEEAKKAQEAMGRDYKFISQRSNEINQAPVKFRQQIMSHVNDDAAYSMNRGILDMAQRYNLINDKQRSKFTQQSNRAIADRIINTGKYIDSNSLTASNKVDLDSMYKKTVSEDTWKGIKKRKFTPEFKDLVKSEALKLNK